MALKSVQHSQCHLWPLTEFQLGPQCFFRITGWLETISCRKICVQPVLLYSMFIKAEVIVADFWILCFNTNCNVSNVRILSDALQRIDNLPTLKLTGEQWRFKQSSKEPQKVNMVNSVVIKTYIFWLMTWSGWPPIQAPMIHRHHTTGVLCSSTVWQSGRWLPFLRVVSGQITHEAPGGTLLICQGQKNYKDVLFHLSHPASLLLSYHGISWQDWNLFYSIDWFHISLKYITLEKLPF